jgi:protein-serine/threonine kinase
MDPNNNNNRINMNYGYNDRNYNAANNRAYPTTPSAFPQPIYQTQGAQDYVDPSNPAYAPGYFMANPPYPAQAQYAQQQQQQQYVQQQALQSPQPAYQTRVGYANDGTNGLIQQFSNQDLNANRGGFFNRAASPASRPRTAGGSPAGQAQAAHLAPPVPRSPRPPAENEELQRLPDRYSENVHKRGKAAKELVTVFFHENIERARDRNMR